MYVCLCHGFTDRQVRSLTGDGERSVAAIYRSLGGPPRCGKCVAFVRRLVGDAASDAGEEAIGVTG